MSHLESQNIGINFSYYCFRCKKASMQVILNDGLGNSKPKLVTFNNKDGVNFTGRQLTCSHFINAQDNPVNYGGKESKINTESETQLDPVELRSLNVTTSIEFLKMNQEQQENYIQFHVAQYKLHLLASKKEKYIVQLLEDLVLKQIELMKGDSEQEQQLKRNMEVKFGYIFRKPEKRLEIIAKEKVKIENAEKKEVKTKDDAMARLKELMRKSGITKEQLSS